MPEMAPLGEREDRPILSIDNLKTYYRQASRSVLSLVGLGEKQYVKAVDDVSIQIQAGCTLGVVGESVEAALSQGRVVE